jgi:hypothetical protein
VAERDVTASQMTPYEIDEAQRLEPKTPPYDRDRHDAEAFEGIGAMSLGTISRGRPQ